jgi:hypothetical protein
MVLDTLLHVQTDEACYSEMQHLGEMSSATW